MLKCPSAPLLRQVQHLRWVYCCHTPWEGPVFRGEKNICMFLAEKNQTSGKRSELFQTLQHRVSQEFPAQGRTHPSSYSPAMLQLLFWSKTVGFSSFCWNVNIFYGSSENESWHCDFTGGNNSNTVIITPGPNFRKSSEIFKRGSLHAFRGSSVLEVWHLWDAATFPKFCFYFRNCTGDVKNNISFLVFSMKVEEKGLKLQHTGAFTLQML